MSFNLGTNDKMYCAELVAKSINQATAGKIQIPAGRINKKIMDKYLKRALDTRIFKTDKEAYELEYISIDNLYMNPHCKEIRRVAYKRPVISF
jgi:ABC-type oligopeptide transport system substrate-binding subunit